MVRESQLDRMPHKEYKQVGTLHANILVCINFSLIWNIGELTSVDSSVDLPRV